MLCFLKHGIFIVYQYAYIVMVYSAFIWYNSVLGINLVFGVTLVCSITLCPVSKLQVGRCQATSSLSPALPCFSLAYWLHGSGYRRIRCLSSWYSLRNSFSKMSRDEISIALISMKSIVLRCYPGKSQHICSTFLPVLTLASPPC